MTHIDKQHIDYTLYLVTDRSVMSDKSLEQAVEQAIQGGCTVVQLREKNITSREFFETAQRIKQITDFYHIPLIINDRTDICLAVNAAGIHVGQQDLPAKVVRSIVGPDKIIGVSAQTVEQAILAEKHGADYLGVGAVFPTGSKDDAEDVPFETLKAICEAVSIPVIAIGGITKDNVKELAGSGICGIAVISAIFASKDIEAATKELKVNTIKAVK